MKNFLFLITFFLALLVTSCNKNETSKNNTADYVEIILEGYTCGDNCYIEYYKSTSTTYKMTALCRADVCGKWEPSGALPSQLKNKKVLAKFSTARQYDGSGTVMDEHYPAITDIKFTDGDLELNTSIATQNDSPSKITENLQGIWKRQSYPYGTIEFKNNQVKFEAGEGSANPAAFKNFEIGEDCKGFTDFKNSFSVITEEGNCNTLRLDRDSFQIFFDAGTSGVTYKKIDTGETNTEQEYTSTVDNSQERILSLEPGFYVMSSAECENPANAFWRYWNGMGLSGSSTKSCGMKLLAREGTTFTVEQTCTNTYDNSKSTTQFTLQVADVNHFSIIQGGKKQEFKFCEETPSWFENK